MYVNIDGVALSRYGCNYHRAVHPDSEKGESDTHVFTTCSRSVDGTPLVSQMNDNKDAKQTSQDSDYDSYGNDLLLWVR